MSRNRPVVPQPTPRISCGTAIEKRFILAKRSAAKAEVLSSAPEGTMEFFVSVLLCLDEGQQRTIGRRGRDANGGCTADTGTADRLLRGGKIACRKHETGTAALG